MAGLENQWLHLAVVKKSSTVQFYLNGVLVGSAEAGVTKDNSISLYLGAKSNANPPNFRFFKGAMDDVRVYNRALSPDDIQAIAER
jgi:hypothetical protein